MPQWSLISDIRSHAPDSFHVICREELLDDTRHWHVFVIVRQQVVDLKIGSNWAWMGLNGPEGLEKPESSLEPKQA